MKRMSRACPDAAILTVVAHPFSAAAECRSVPAGRSVEEIAAEAQPDPALRAHAHAWLDGAYLPREDWARTVLAPGAALCLRMVPMGGGGGKNPLRTLLSMAVIAATGALGAGLVSALGATAQASVMGISLGRAVSAGAGMLGRLALKALAPPGRPRFSGRVKESPALFIQGARNAVLPFGRVPRVLGRHRMVPPMGALPYTETVGGEQYLRLLFVWGYGPLEISDLKIGETPLSEFEGVEIETRQGFPADAPLSLYSDSVLQNDLQVTLTNAAGYVTRTGAAEVDEVSVDITFPRGLFLLGAGGEKKPATVNIEVQYSPAGADTWSAAATGYKAVAAQAVSLPRPEAYQYRNVSHAVTRIDRVVLDRASGAVSVVRGPAFRVGIDAGSAQAPDVPANMIAVARVERRSGDAAVIPAGRITDERKAALFGAAFEDSGSFAPSAAASANALDIAAGGLQFSGLAVTAAQTAALRRNVSFRVPRGQYDVRLRRLTADAGSDSLFDETVWTALRGVRHAAPVAMAGLAMTALRIKATDQLSGQIDRFNGVAHSILPDWTGTEWVEQVTSSPASVFRHVLQGAANARPLDDSRIDLDRLEAWHDACAAAGREFNAIIDYDVSVRGVLHDVAAAGRAAPTLVDGKWAVVEDAAQFVPVQHFTPRNTYGFRGEKSFDDLPHALRVRFVNRDKGWLQDEVLIFDDGYDAATATKYEALELAGVTDAIQAWKDGRYHIATARLRPETYTFHTDMEHIVCTRGDLVRFTHDVPLFGLAAGRVKAVGTEGGSAVSVTLDEKVTMEAEKSYALRFRLSDGTSLVKAVQTAVGEDATLMFETPFPEEGAPAPGDLAQFGESGQESVELVVRSIEPHGDMGARLTCVDAAPGVHMAEAAEIPAFSAQVTVPTEMRRPPAPAVTGVSSGAGVSIRGADGSEVPAIAITLAAADFPLPLAVEARIRHPEETDFRPAQFSAGGGQVTVIGVTPGALYDLSLTHRSALGVSSAPVVVSNYRVEALPPPADVAGFTANAVGDGAHLSWEPVSGTGVSHYSIRFSGDASGVTWAGAFTVVSRIARAATSVSLPALAGTWLIKAVDHAGRESENAATAVSAGQGAGGYVLQDVVDETSVLGLSMSEDSEGVVYTGDDRVVLDDVLGGTYVFNESVDLMGLFTALLTARMTVLGVVLDDSVDIWGDVDLVGDWDGTQDPSTWGAQMQLRTTDDDPGGTPSWSGWRNFVVGEYTARGIEFRVLLTSAVEGVSPAISALEVDVSMKSWQQAETGMTSDAADADAGGGTLVLFPEEFFTLSAVSVTPHDMATGDYYTVTNHAEIGFSIQFFNASDSRVTRDFDYIAQGVGRRA